jgi:hypothetical protein
MGSSVRAPKQLAESALPFQQAAAAFRSMQGKIRTQQIRSLIPFRY